MHSPSIRHKPLAHGWVMQLYCKDCGRESVEAFYTTPEALIKQTESLLTCWTNCAPECTIPATKSNNAEE